MLMLTNLLRSKQTAGNGNTKTAPIGWAWEKLLFQIILEKKETDKQSFYNRKKVSYDKN